MPKGQEVQGLKTRVSELREERDTARKMAAQLQDDLDREVQLSAERALALVEAQAEIDRCHEQFDRYRDAVFEQINANGHSGIVPSLWFIYADELR